MRLRILPLVFFSGLGLANAAPASGGSESKKEKISPEALQEALSTIPAFADMSYELSEIICNPYPAGHNNIRAQRQTEHAYDACRSFGDVLGPTDNPQIYVKGYDDKSFDPKRNPEIYRYTISWLPNCDIDGKLRDIQLPDPHTPLLTCPEIFSRLYLNCKMNQGAGGQAQSGCLIYDFSSA